MRNKSRNSVYRPYSNDPVVADSRGIQPMIPLSLLDRLHLLIHKWVYRRNVGSK